MQQVIIIGAGPAGIACAIQLKRFGIDVAIFEKEKVGGLIKNANLIENYLGFPQGISGIEYVELIEKQLNQYNIPIFNEEVIKITKKQEAFKLLTGRNHYQSRFLVLATGTVAKKIHFENEKIFYEVEPLLNKKNKNITIIGAGDAAFDYALNLSKHNKINIINRSTKIKALPLLISRVKNNTNIDYIENFETQEIKFNDTKLFIRSKNNQEILSNYILAAIGRVPEDSLLKNLKTDLKQIPGLYMIGDVKNGILRQTSVATGDGLRTAAQIYDQI